MNVELRTSNVKRRTVKGVGRRFGFGAFGFSAVCRLLICCVLGCALAAAIGRDALSDAEPLSRARAVREALGLPAADAIRPITQIPRGGANDPGLSPADHDTGVVLKKIVEAEALAAKHQWVQASGKFHELLDRFGDTVVPIDRDTSVPAWRYCTARLFRLGPDALSSYRGSYDDAAAKALDAAKAARSADALLDVARRYGATRPGLAALDVLASIEMERGRPAAAAQICVRRLELETSAMAEPEHRLLAKLACALAAGRPDKDRLARLRSLAAAVRAHYASAQIESSGRLVTMPELVASHLASAQERTAVTLEADSQEAPGQIAARAVRPEILLWQAPLQKEPENIGPPAPRKRPAAAPPPELAPFVPVFHEDALYSQSRDCVLAVDLLTGRTLWKLDLSDEECMRPFRAPARGNGVLAPAIAGGSVIATFVTPLTDKGADGWVRTVDFGRMDALPARPDPLAGSLVPTVWSVNTRQEGPKPAADVWAPAFRFTSRPMLVGDTLCVPARYADADTDAFVLGYDLTNGRRLWQTRVAGDNWGPDAGVQSGYTNGSPVVGHDGIAYYCSDMGTVAAVDVADGSIIWVTRYESAPALSCKMETLGGDNAAVPAPPNPPLISSGTLFVLPSNSAYVYALDAWTGAVKWRRPRSEGRWTCLFLLAADERRVFLSGYALVCLDAKDGSILWRSTLFDSFPVGRGIVAQDYAMCPIEGSIAMIEVEAEGRLAEPVDWRELRRKIRNPQSAIHNPIGSGNMVILDHRLIVAREDSISVFVSQDAVRLLSDRAAREPNNPKHFLDLAALHAGAGRLADAAAACKQALAAKPGPEGARARSLLADIYAELAAGLEQTKSWSEAATVLREALALGQQDRPAAALMVLRRAAALEEANELPQALAALHEVLREYGDEEPAVPSTLLASVNGLTLRADILAALQIERLLRTRGWDAYGPFDEQAQAILDKAPQDARAAAFRQIVRLFPNSGAAAELRLKRAEDAIRQNRPAAASGELLAIERLCGDRRKNDVEALRQRIADAARPARKPGIQKEHGGIAWQVPLHGRQAIPESLAGPGGTPPGNELPDRCLLAADRSLRAYDVRDGKQAWATTPGWLGVSFEAASVAPPGMPRPAIEFREVLPGYPAHKSGLRAGDLLVSFDGHTLRGIDDLGQLCRTTPSGNVVEVLVLRNGRPLKLHVTVGERPETLEGPYHLADTMPHEFIRVVGLDGDTVIADHDLTLLRIDAKTGRRLARTVIDRLPPGSSWAGVRGTPPFIARGARLVMGDGTIIAPTPSGRLVCFDLDDYKRRWTVQLPGMVAWDLTLWNGMVAVIAHPVDRERISRPVLFVFDAFSGLQMLRDELDETRVVLGESKLIPAGNKLLVAVPGRVLCYAPAAGKRLWSIKEENPVVSGVYANTAVYGDKVIATLNPGTIVAASLETGDVVWKAETLGGIHRVLFTSVNGPDGNERGERKPGEDRVLVAAERDGRYYVICYRLSDGKRLWDTTVAEKVQLRPGPGGLTVPFARVIGGRLFLVQNLMDEVKKPLPPSVAIIDISSGKRLSYVGLGVASGYNVLGGKLGRGVIVLILESGLIGISTAED